MKFKISLFLYRISTTLRPDAELYFKNKHKGMKFFVYSVITWVAYRLDKDKSAWLKYMENKIKELDEERNEH